MTGERIMAAVAAVYAGCRTYTDSGCVRTVFFRPGGGTTTALDSPFETAFVRPDRFRLEYSGQFPGSSKWHRYVIAATPDGAQAWTDRSPAAGRYESIDAAFLASRKPPAIAPTTVPALLMPGAAGPNPFAAGPLRRLEDGEADGVDCYRVEMVRPPVPEFVRERIREFTAGLPEGTRVPSPGDPDPDVLWVAKGTLLLLRVERAHRYDTFRTQAVTGYAPAIDGPVPDERLAFDPPEGAG
jgi:hypothetical protein